jgi:hypothetical protein
VVDADLELDPLLQPASAISRATATAGARRRLTS